MVIQEISQNLCKVYLELGNVKQKVKFLNSCVSQGLIPKGLISKFNLAMNVNDPEFVEQVQSLVNEKASRLLDLIFSETCENERVLADQLEELKDQARATVGHNDAGIIFRRSYSQGSAAVGREGWKFRDKLKRLRLEHNNVPDDNFERCNGSRKVIAQKYIKKVDDGEPRGAPFPKNLRKSRRNRPHRRDGVHSQEYVVTAEDVEERNPIIASKQVVNISEDGKALLRKSPKFCPSPKGPIEEMEQYKSFLRFQQSMRWKWFFNKEKDPFNIIDDYQPQPWHSRTDRQAPIATDAPELEAFLAGMEKDLRSPELRRKMKNNLNQNQKNFIKEVKEEYPQRGLRVRREDKGHRFVIEDAVTEDNKIIEELSDPVFYTETDDNPIENFKDEIQNWADDALENEEINTKQHRFVTDSNETHLANPKPLYKTHKTDGDGVMLDPIPIRTLTVGCGTPVHSLSKLCQLSIEHLTSKDELPRNCKSTKEILRVVNTINENNTPLPDSACLILPDTVKMYLLYIGGCRPTLHNWA